MKLSVMTLPLLPAPNIPGLEQTAKPEKVPGLQQKNPLQSGSGRPWRI